MKTRTQSFPTARCAWDTAKVTLKMLGATVRQAQGIWLVGVSRQSEFRGKNLPGGGYMLFANTVHQSESSYGDLRASGLLGAYRSVLVARAGETEGRPRGLDCPDYALAWACRGPQEKFQNSFFVY